MLTLPDSICWLLNIRGTDVAHNPIVLAFMIVHAVGKPELFVDAIKVGAEVKKHLAGLVKIEPPAALAQRLKALKGAGKRVRLDAAYTGDWFFRATRKERPQRR